MKYYHVVFTLPHELNSLVLGHQRLLYGQLFDASAATLQAFSKDEKYLGAQPGIISVLHIPRSGTGSGGSNFAFIRISTAS